MLGRALAGAVAAAVVVIVAYRVRSLSASGAVAAVVVGAAAVAVGWEWGALLMLYFVSSVLLSHAGRDVKTRRTQSIVAKGGPRDATQVLANGGLFALLALVSSVLADARADTVALAALGALAAAAADTWATEVGTLLGGTPWSLRGLHRVPPGTSGGLTVSGTLAMLAGASFVALAAQRLSIRNALLAITVGGVAGALADTLLGEMVQERRWCAPCERETERRVHDCGQATTLHRGASWLDNDAVNFAATVAGALVAAGLRLIHRTA
jgi:uncharacterized protein (TIGR00297 family)